MRFDRFDVCAAWAQLAHDWGLYAVVSRLDDMGYRPSPSLSLETLSDNARAIYDHNDGYLREFWRSASPNDRKPFTMKDTRR